MALPPDPLASLWYAPKSVALVAGSWMAGCHSRVVVKPPLTDVAKSSEPVPSAAAQFRTTSLPPLRLPKPVPRQLVGVLPSLPRVKMLAPKAILSVDVPRVGRSGRFWPKPSDRTSQVPRGSDESERAKSR